MPEQTTRRNGAPQPARPTQQQPFADAAPVRRTLYDYDIPDEDGLHAEVTKDFGSLRVVSLKTLTPLEERAAAQAAKQDPLVMAQELVKRSLAEVTNSDGQSFAVNQETRDMLWSQMHPKIRDLAAYGFSDVASNKEETRNSFLGSRRIRV